MKITRLILSRKHGRGFFLEKYRPKSVLVSDVLIKNFIKMQIFIR